KIRADSWFARWPRATAKPCRLISPTAWRWRRPRPARSNSATRRGKQTAPRVAAAAEAMRRILVENALRKKCLKRGGARARLPLEEGERRAPGPPEEVLAVDEALTELAATDRAAADLVQLRYFGGLSIPDAARVLGVSPRTAKRMWAFARAWLQDRLQGAGREDNPS